VGDAATSSTDLLDGESAVSLMATNTAASDASDASDASEASEASDEGGLDLGFGLGSDGESESATDGEGGWFSFGNDSDSDDSWWETDGEGGGWFDTDGEGWFGDGVTDGEGNWQLPNIFDGETWSNILDAVNPFDDSEDGEAATPVSLLKTKDTAY